jgi:tRNA (cytidine32/uridine32-2'-O)-methyltransferase
MTTDITEHAIRIVLVETTHPGNIGATARAMKCMGLKQLYLVNPPDGYPGANVTARAAGADDILANAVICDSLGPAIRDCVFVAGTTARDRSIPWPVLMPEQCAQRALADAVSGPVAILFGRERSGLKNEEIDHCHCVVHIPANPSFSSLNIAAAVQIMAYELFLAIATAKPAEPVEPRIPLATAGQLEQLYEHLERCMTRVEFFDPEKPRRLQRRLRCLFNRAQLDQNELNILRGFLAAVEEKTPGNAE